MSSLNGRKPLLRFSSPSLNSLRVFRLKFGGKSINIGGDRYPGSFKNVWWYCCVCYWMGLHFIACYCMTLHGNAERYMLLHGMSWCYMQMYSIVLFCIVLYGIARCYMLLHGISCTILCCILWYYMVLHGINQSHILREDTFIYSGAWYMLPWYKLYYWYNHIILLWSRLVCHCFIWGWHMCTLTPKVPKKP